ncbi:MAG: hypothetical protein ABIH03_15310 [Pseudomonadota bacterium]
MTRASHLHRKPKTVRKGWRAELASRRGNIESARRRSLNSGDVRMIRLPPCSPTMVLVFVRTLGRVPDWTRESEW